MIEKLDFDNATVYIDLEPECMQGSRLFQITAP